MIKNLIKNLKKRTDVTGYSWGTGFNSSQTISIHRSGQIVNVYLWLETTTDLTTSWKTVLSGLPSTGLTSTAFTSVASYNGKSVILRVIDDRLEARSGTSSSTSYNSYANIMYIAATGN